MKKVLNGLRDGGHRTSPSSCPSRKCNGVGHDGRRNRPNYYRKNLLMSETINNHLFQEESHPAARGCEFRLGAVKPNVERDMDLKHASLALPSLSPRLCGKRIGDAKRPVSV
jgi:hypothetical protein